MFVRITYSNNYCGCDEVDVMEVLNMKEAEDEATTHLQEYAENYDYVATGWGEDFESDEEREYYYENCSYEIEEITEKEYLEEM